MTIQNIFSKTFEGIELYELNWKETGRYGPKEFFGKKSDDELDPKYFMRSDGSPRIPVDISDAFYYTLETSNFKADFGQTYFNFCPLTTQQYLSFFFGKSTNPDNLLGIAKGFEFLSEAKMRFCFSKSETLTTNITMESQNLKMYKQGSDMNNFFTDLGNTIMLDLLSQKENFTKIYGLKAEDNELLYTLFGNIEQDYQNNNLNPMGWRYT